MKIAVPKKIAAIICLFLLGSHVGYSQFIDPNFKPRLIGSTVDVSALAVEESGSILVAGNLIGIHDNYGIGKLVRLNENGVLDVNFNPQFDPNATIGVIFPLEDGRVLVSGYVGGDSFDFPDTMWIVRLHPDGTLDESFEAQLDEKLWNITYIQVQNDGKIVLTGLGTNDQSTFKTHRIQRLNANGSNDESFKVSSPNHSNLFVYRESKVLIQNDGKILFEGQFTHINDSIVDKRIVRLNSDGSLDNSFKSNRRGIETDIDLDKDGKIILSGYLGDSSTWGVVRLNDNGTIDTTFTRYHTTERRRVKKLFVLPDGGFLLIESEHSNYKQLQFVRLNSNGTIDTEFTSPEVKRRLYWGVYLMFHQMADDKMILFGDFSEVNGKETRGVFRINLDGTVDDSFDWGFQGNPSASTIKKLNENSIIATGDISNANGINTQGVVKIFSDGTFDNNFLERTDLDFLTSSLYDVEESMNGQFYVAGDFSRIRDHETENIARINSDGSVDTTFSISGISLESIRTILVQEEGKIIIGGEFQGINGVNISNFARLNADGTVDTSFNSNNSFANPVYDIKALSDGKFLLNVNYRISPRYGAIYRAGSDGNLDPSFHVILNPTIKPIGDFLVFEDSAIVVLGHSGTINFRPLFSLMIYNYDGTNRRYLISRDELFGIEKVSDTEFMVSGVGLLKKIDLHNNEDVNFSLEYNGFIEKMIFHNDSLYLKGTMTEVEGERVYGLAKISSASSMPSAPSALMLSDVTSDSITIEWTDNSTLETGFEVFRKINDADFERYAVVDANVNSFQDAKTEIGDFLEYKVRAVNLTKFSDFTNEVRFDIVTSVIESTSNRQRVIYPNPGTSRFYWYQAVNPEIIQIYRLDGALVKSVTLNELNNYSFDLSDEPSGVYIVKSLDQPSIVKRVVKN